jgi:hypothetical protein
VRPENCFHDRGNSEGRESYLSHVHESCCCVSAGLSGTGGGGVKSLLLPLLLLIAFAWFAVGVLWERLPNDDTEKAASAKHIESDVRTLMEIALWHDGRVDLDPDHAAIAKDLRAIVAKHRRPSGPPPPAPESRNPLKPVKM